MTLKTRLSRVEQHPRTEIAQELRRLQEQGAKPLFEVAAALMEAHPDDVGRVLVEMTDAQLLRLLWESELTPEAKAVVESNLARLPSLLEEARRNVKLMHEAPLSLAEQERQQEDMEDYLKRYGLRPPPEPQKRPEGYDAI